MKKKKKRNDKFRYTKQCFVRLKSGRTNKKKKKERTDGSLKFSMRILLFYTLCVNFLLARRSDKDNYNLIREEFRYS